MNARKLVVGLFEPVILDVVFDGYYSTDEQWDFHFSMLDSRELLGKNKYEAQKNGWGVLSIVNEGLGELSSPSSRRGNGGNSLYGGIGAFDIDHFRGNGLGEHEDFIAMRFSNQRRRRYTLVGRRMGG